MIRYGCQQFNEDCPLKNLHRFVLSNFKHQKCRLQGDIAQRKNSKSCLFAIQLNNYFPLRQRWALLSDHCRLESQFDKIRKGEGYDDSVSNRRPWANRASGVWQREPSMDRSLLEAHGSIMFQGAASSSNFKRRH